MNTKRNIQIITRIILLLLSGFFLLYVYQKGFIITIIVSVLIIVFQIILFIDFQKKILADVEKSIDCLLYDDFSVSIPENKRKIPIHNKTALLIEKYKRESLVQTSEHAIFTNIIESLDFGVLILRKDSNNQIEVYQINDAFVNVLQIPKFYNWKLLKNKIAPFANLIDDSNWKKIKHVLTLTINDKAETFYLKTSVTNTFEFDYFTVSLETIQQVIDKKEKESWFKLLNVMSHEIINTITPISSLASNLHSLLQDENPGKETLEELSEGLRIIKKRSLHLTDFVSTYRKLAELPLPDKKETNIIQLLHSSLTLFKQEFDHKKISIQIEEHRNIFLNIDKKQIEQVFINIISNCIYALEDTENPKIQIGISQTNLRTYIHFTDNGIGIITDIKDNIFVPYFTTRKNGSGIGLTLSKNIMESHDGTIYFKSIEGETIFTLNFGN